MSEIYEAEVKDVFSGDDLILMVDLRVEGLFKRQRVRLLGVDTPNGLNAGAETEAGKVRSYVKGLCTGRKLRITVARKDVSSWVATVEVYTGAGLLNINEDLRKQGYTYKRER